MKELDDKQNKKRSLRWSFFYAYNF